MIKLIVKPFIYIGDQELYNTLGKRVSAKGKSVLICKQNFLNYSKAWTLIITISIPNRQFISDSNDG